MIREWLDWTWGCRPLWLFQVCKDLHTSCCLHSDYSPWSIIDYSVHYFVGSQHHGCHQPSHGVSTLLETILAFLIGPYHMHCTVAWGGSGLFSVFHFSGFHFWFQSQYFLDPAKHFVAFLTLMGTYYAHPLSRPLFCLHTCRFPTPLVIIGKQWAQSFCQISTFWLNFLIVPLEYLHIYTSNFITNIIHIFTEFLSDPWAKTNTKRCHINF